MQEKEFVIVPPSPVDTSNFPLITDLQFLEPFGSESLNRKFFGITPPGIYRGFQAELPGGMVLRIGRAGEAGTAIVELNNEHCLTIQQRHPVDLQVKAGFSGFVVLEGFYKFGVPTMQVDTASAIEAARILLVTQPEIRPDHVTLYALNVPAGATALTEAMLSTEHRQDVAIAGPEAAMVSERLEQHKESRDHPTGTKTDPGMLRLATDAEATAGVTDEVAVTPKQLMGAINAHYLPAGSTLPAKNIGPIWHDDYASWMVWQEFTANGANYRGYASQLIGSLLLDTQPTPRAGYIKSGVQNLSRVTYAALRAWAQHNGLMVVPGVWTAGTIQCADNTDGTTFRIYDVRGEFLRAWDDGRGVDSGRTFGSAQGDAIRNIVANLYDVYGGNSLTSTGAMASAVINNTSYYGASSGGVPLKRVTASLFDASLVVPTAAENRPISTAVLAAIKF